MPSAPPSLDNQQFAAYVQSMLEGLLLVDLRGVLLALNRSALECLALREPPAAGSRLDALGPAGAAVHSALNEALTPDATRERQARVAVPGNGTLFLVMRSPEDGRVGLLMRREAPGESQLHRALAQELHLEGSLARLAIRLYQGWPNLAIAQAFGVPLGTVKRRAHDLCRRLGVRRRVDVMRLVANVASRSVRYLQAARELPTAELPLGDSSSLSALRTFLHTLSLGFAALDPRGRLLWANPTAARLLRCTDDGRMRLAEPTLRDLRQATRVARGAHRAQRFRMRSGRTTVRVDLWRDGRGGIGLGANPEAGRTAGSRAALIEKFELTDREAAVTALMARGATNPEIGRSLGVRPGTVMSLSGRIFEKLGVRSRLALAALVADALGTAADARA